MLDIGWSELLVVAVVAIIVVGPKDLPAMLRSIGRIVGQMKRMANEFTSQFDDAMREAELDQIRTDNPWDEVKSSVTEGLDPLNDLPGDIERAGDKSAKSAKKSDEDDLDDFDDPGAEADYDPAPTPSIGTATGADAGAGEASGKAAAGEAGGSAKSYVNGRGGEGGASPAGPVAKRAAAGSSTTKSKGTLAERAETSWKAAQDENGA